ncbi:hypothetical protein BDP27DRAFT_1364932 [Rhodocollybia butyracea]|uniref:Uncharacterized protein n=1 Tax=Rhodocollybia butyracea TaxID=206335 RepID=A0A9P5PQH0_9AGAR|nr:hypothetical protein BDP27DRAFT_1364932 [Rhodocollybia butyracea]
MSHELGAKKSGIFLVFSGNATISVQFHLASANLEISTITHLRIALRGRFESQVWPIARVQLHFCWGPESLRGNMKISFASANRQSAQLGTRCMSCLQDSLAPLRMGSSQFRAYNLRSGEPIVVEDFDLALALEAAASYQDAEGKDDCKLEAELPGDGIDTSQADLAPAEQSFSFLASFGIEDNLPPNRF